MQQPPFRFFDDIATREIAPGFFSKLVHTPNNTINFITVKAGCSVPLHQHIHRQSSFVIEGEFEMTVAGETRILTPSSFVVIEPDTIHGGTAVTDCKLIDIFDPVREDYKKLTEQ
ncbi:hypothetical protein BEL04_14435 [Mucilaginibacter sp. PPCGB 2223]|uniref:cupin domain-containing protein n=1 Tax=Mucilaginibacter sp. PPCGB 2223 TaxID=1886027 RepID=UPI000826111D|nr:cupin domain-containing protein [Mucilaginibacter sp. PPCGB 2223]OCX52640.1 hypothetical protein BEL04_14435 [Mucilaginibacter sp. PPCGB 2223]